MYAIITGCSRGIGLELTRLALDKGYTVLAVARSPEKAQELTELDNKWDKLKILKCDLTYEASIKLIQDSISHWPQLDLLINNAGIYEGDEKISNFEKSFLVNSIMPHFITQGLLTKLKVSATPKAVFISSQMGSISDNSSGGSYSYRSSKSALNMLVKSLTLDHAWLTTLLVHPGWVKTRMGGDKALISTHDSASGIWELIEKLRIQDSGSFWDYRGKILHF